MASTLGLEGVAGLQAGSGLISGIAGIFQSRSAAKAARAAADRAIEAAEANALLLEKMGNRAASETRNANTRLLMQQRVAYAANGVNVGTGSALDVALDGAIEGEVEALRVKFGFTSAAYQERVRGIISAYRAESAASNIETSGLTQGLSTILGGATSALGTLAQKPTPLNTVAVGPPKSAALINSSFGRIG